MSRGPAVKSGTRGELDGHAAPGVLQYDPSPPDPRNCEPIRPVLPSEIFHLDRPSALERAAMKASWGTSTRPTIFIRFLPSFCFSRSLRLRVMSPP
jgi:hypothetical protein